MNLNKLFELKNYLIIDVRTPGEFNGRNVAGSINIPLNEIPERLTEIGLFKKPLIICCASGMRSEQAVQYLTHQNISCYNGGSWLDVNYYLSKNN